MDLVSLSNNGGVSAIPQAPQFHARVTNSGCNTGCCGSSSPYDLDQWMPGQKSEVTVSIFGFDVEKAEESAKTFSKHFACVRPGWEINIVKMSKEDFETWISDGEMKAFAENLKNAKEAISHSTSDGPFIAIGDRYVGSTEKLHLEIEKRKREFKELMEYKSKSQQRKWMYAVLAIVVMIGLCYLVLYITVESKKWFDPSISFRNQLVAFYEKHNPEKLLNDASHVDNLMKKYRGKETKLMNVLRKKYGEL